MKATFYTVNDNGLNQIHEFLSASHKLGGARFDKDMLRAWASDAEFQISEGNTASIELHSWETVSGRTETFTIDSNGLDAHEVEIDE